MEAGLERNEEGQQGKSYTGMWAAVGVFLVVYFCFPVVLIYPLYAIYHHRRVPPALETGITIFFYPVMKLEQTVPAYRRLLQSEAGLLGIN